MDFFSWNTYQEFKKTIRIWSESIYNIFYVRKINSLMQNSAWTWTYKVLTSRVYIIKNITYSIYYSQENIGGSSKITLSSELTFSGDTISSPVANVGIIFFF
jgi:hypothetical protein